MFTCNRHGNRPITLRLLVWIAIGVPLLTAGIQLLEVQDWGMPTALSQPPAEGDRSDTHDTFVPIPNQPPVFTRGSGTR